ncbi:MAG TPA: SDR family oxidoreductase [Candidatus Nanoarchaeia archaeon]|nr:SDR family oxidoreductase [Candidatus Nanoarchaeia archaeon]
MDIKGKTVLVTGSAGRVGKQIALYLAGKGANIIVHYLHSDAEARQTAAEIRKKRVKAIAVRADLTQEDEVAQLFAAGRKAFGRVDVLVNSAAAFRKTPLSKAAASDLDFFYQTNVRSGYLCSLLFARQARKGVIVNIGDWAAERPYMDYLPYLISKGAIPTMTRAFAKELAPGIRVNCILPGPVLLPRHIPAAEKREAIAGTLVQRAGSPLDIAQAVVFLIENEFVTGACLSVDGGRSCG